METTMQPDDVTDFQFTLLGLLTFGPMAGYDLKKAFATSPLSRYSPSSGGIYPALGRLEKMGLAEAYVDSADELRPRRVFSPTPAGLQALDTWLCRPVDRETVSRNISTVPLRFVLMERRLARVQVLAFLDDLTAALEVYLADLARHQAATSANAGHHAVLALDFGVSMVRTQLAWAARAGTELRGLSPE
jgi:DNA-binding PadR family transcriptional regulator